MIPILFAPDGETKIGYLKDCTSAEVVEERNGKFEFTFKYPVSGSLFYDLMCDSIVYAKPNELSQTQPFRIYKISKPIKGITTCYAEHASYELKGNVIARDVITTEGAAGAIEAVLNAGEFDCDYIPWSDIENQNSINLQAPVTVRQALGGVRGSILDIFGGEYEFDRKTIKLYRKRGVDRDVQIRYGKNMTDIKLEINYESVYTSILPYARYTPEGSTTEYIVVADLISLGSENEFAYPRAYILDLTDKIQEGEAVTRELVASLASTYISNNDNIGEPKKTLTVSFIPLWQTEEYKNIAPLERCNLCDTVEVIHDILKIKERLKIISTTYDVLAERYTKMTLGTPASSLSSIVNSTSSDISNLSDQIKQNASTLQSYLEQSIADATNAITGQFNSFVVLNPSVNPQELLILDTPDINAAVNVWRFNSGGLGHSSNGYNGPYELAMTHDGNIVADIIRVGTLDANLIRVGLKEYIRMSGSRIELGQDGSPVQAVLTDDELAFIENGIKLAYFSENQMSTTDVVVKNSLTLSNEAKNSSPSDLSKFIFIPRENGNLSVKWSGS